MRHLTVQRPRHLAALLALTAAAFGVQAQTTPATPKSAATPVESMDAAFKRADLDQDGHLSRDEAARIPALADRFAQVDTDKDGRLSPAEVAAALRAPAPK